MSTLAVEATGVEVDFGEVHALRGVDLSVPAGSTLAVLGHNGAGKTTLIRTLTSVLRPTRGRIVIAGIDLAVDPVAARRRIGVTGQFSGLDDYLTGRENLRLFARLMGLGRTFASAVDDIAERLALGPIVDQRVGTLSGGSRRRIDLAASLVARPDVLFLDEPTTGLDRIARSALWEVVRSLMDEGCTVVLTTQYLEDADRLADHVVVLESGRVIADGPPARLKQLVGTKVVTARIRTADLDRLSLRPDVTTAADSGRSSISYVIADPGDTAEVVATLASSGVSIDDLDVSSLTLDDVFAHLTSRDLAMQGASS